MPSKQENTIWGGAQAVIPLPGIDTVLLASEGQHDITQSNGKGEKKTRAPGDPLDSRPLTRGQQEGSLAVGKAGANKI